MVFTGKIRDVPWQTISDLRRAMILNGLGRLVGKLRWILEFQLLEVEKIQEGR